MLNLKPKSGTIFLNVLVIFSISIMVITASSQKFSTSQGQYLLLDQRYRQAILNELSQRREIKFLESENA